MPILGDFAVKYGSISDDLGVPASDLYQALVATAENTVSNTPSPTVLTELIVSVSHQIGIEVLISVQFCD
jgi:hypothetical protein